MNEDAPNIDSTPVTNAQRRVTLILTGVLGGICGLVAFLWFQRGGAIPSFTKDDFEAAQSRWRAAQVESYDVQIEVTGRQSAIYRVKVRAGQVLEATRNDLPLKQRRTMGTWSVPGMFDTMSRDVENRELTEAGKGGRNVPQLTLRCKFHPQYGYPEVYQRLEHRKFASNMEVTWRVTKFEIQ